MTILSPNNKWNKHSLIPHTVHTPFPVVDFSALINGDGKGIERIKEARTNLGIPAGSYTPVFRPPVVIWYLRGEA